MRCGTIPACAGSTARPVGGVSRSRDHPRVRGEHWRGLRSAPTVVGPSPRARGAPSMASSRSRKLGTIPACAGSTRCFGPLGVVRRDHPRVRGEHSERPGTLPAFRTVFLHFSKNRQNTHPVENHPQKAACSPRQTDRDCPWPSPPAVRPGRQPAPEASPKHARPRSQPPVEFTAPSAPRVPGHPPRRAAGRPGGPDGPPGGPVPPAPGS